MIESSSTIWRRGRQSIRTQLILGAIVGLTLVLALFGFFVRYIVKTTLINSVDSNLQEHILQAQRRPPPPHSRDDHGPGDQFQGFRGPGPDGSGQNQPGPNNQFFGQGSSQYDQQRPGFGQFEQYQNHWPNNGQQQPNGQGFDGQPPSDQGPMDHGPFDQGPGHEGDPNFGQQFGNQPPGAINSAHNPSGPNPIIGNPPGGSSPISSSAINVLNQQDQLYHPRRFSLDGRSLDRFNRGIPWDLSAITLASSRNRLVYSDVIDDGIHLRVLTEPVKTPDGQSWFFQAPYPMTETDRAISGVDRALLLLIPVALIIAGVGGLLLTRRVLSRVGQLVNTAAGIGVSDLSQRLPVVGSDEFADLAETFNALLSRVETAFQEQQRIVEQQRRFTADASHELKTPLTIIRGTTSLALSSGGTMDRQSTEDIDGAAASMSVLVQDLIYLARADAGQLGRQRIELLLIDPLQRAIDRISTISVAPIRLVEAHENLVVSADESEMVRLFGNVLQNAAYHTPPDGRIIVSVSSTSDEAIIMISDSGIGIAPQHIEHLGERFYRVDSSRTRTSEVMGGSGLGLAICIGIIEAHGGTIGFDSVLGKGTTVTITLPKVTVADPLTF